MTSQVTLTTVETPALQAWGRLLRGHAALVRDLNAQLVREHALTINDYEALLVLSHAEGRRLRRIDLAQRLSLTASGVTRLLDGLESAGLVCKCACSSDGRVSYAVLTDSGLDRLRAASQSHVAEVEQLLAGLYAHDELEMLAELLGRLPGAAGDARCAVVG